MANSDLSPADVAALYGLSTGTLANWRAQDKGPPFLKHRKHRNAAVTYPAIQAIRWGRENGYIKEAE